MGGIWQTIIGVVAAVATPLVVRRVSKRGLQDLTDARVATGEFRKWFKPALVKSRGPHQQRKAILVAFAATVTLVTGILLIYSSSRTRATDAAPIEVEQRRGRTGPSTATIPAAKQ
jgi:hypothetical protein